MHDVHRRQERKYYYHQPRSLDIEIDCIIVAPVYWIIMTIVILLLLLLLLYIPTAYSVLRTYSAVLQLFLALDWIGLKRNGRDHWKGTCTLGSPALLHSLWQRNATQPPFQSRRRSPQSNTTINQTTKRPSRQHLRFLPFHRSAVLAIFSSFLFLVPPSPLACQQVSLFYSRPS